MLMFTRRGHFVTRLALALNSAAIGWSVRILWQPARESSSVRVYRSDNSAGYLALSNLTVMVQDVLASGRATRCEGALESAPARFLETMERLAYDAAVRRTGHSQTHFGHRQILRTAFIEICGAVPRACGGSVTRRAHGHLLG